MDHHSTTVYGSIQVCDTCVNSLGYPVNWEQAYCHKPFDPLPYVSDRGRRAFGYIGKGTERIVFDPRPAYEQDQSKYRL